MATLTSYPTSGCSPHTFYSQKGISHRSALDFGSTMDEYFEYFNTLETNNFQMEKLEIPKQLILFSLIEFRK